MAVAASLQLVVVVRMSEAFVVLVAVSAVAAVTAVGVVSSTDKHDVVMTCAMVRTTSLFRRLQSSLFQSSGQAVRHSNDRGPANQSML